MRAAFFLTTPGRDGSDGKPRSEVIRDPIEALRKFLQAVEDEEWAELRWSW